MGTSGNVVVMQFPNNYVPPMSSDREDAILRLGHHNNSLVPQFTEVQTPIVHGGLVSSTTIYTSQTRASIVIQLPIDVITAIEEPPHPPCSQSASAGE